MMNGGCPGEADEGRRGNLSDLGALGRRPLEAARTKTWEKQGGVGMRLP